MKKEIGLSIFIVVALLTIVIFFDNNSTKNFKKEFKSKVEEKGYQVIEVDKIGAFESKPFFLVDNKSQKIFKITYLDKEEEKVVWVRTGLFKDTWKW